MVDRKLLIQYLDSQIRSVSDAEFVREGWSFTGLL